MQKCTVCKLSHKPACDGATLRWHIQHVEQLHSVDQQSSCTRCHFLLHFAAAMSQSCKTPQWSHRKCLWAFFFSAWTLSPKSNKHGWWGKKAKLLRLNLSKVLVALLLRFGWSVSRADWPQDTVVLAATAVSLSATQRNTDVMLQNWVLTFAPFDFDGWICFVNLMGSSQD